MWNWIKAKWKGFFSSEGGKVMKDAMAGLLKLVGPIAADLLLSEAKRLVKLEDIQIGLTGDMKAANVRAYLKAFAADRGLKIADKVINKAIEDAVMALEA